MFSFQTPGAAVEALISINNHLRQPEAAIGILTKAQQDLHMELKESWYEKLQRWEEALEAYERKYAASPPASPAHLEATLGRMRCASQHIHSTACRLQKLPQAWCLRSHVCVPCWGTCGAHLDIMSLQKHAGMSAGQNPALKGRGMGAGAWRRWRSGSSWGGCAAGSGAAWSRTCGATWPRSPRTPPGTWASGAPPDHPDIR